MNITELLTQTLIDHSTTVPGELDCMKCAKCGYLVYKRGIPAIELQKRVSKHQAEVIAELLTFARAYEKDSK